MMPIERKRSRSGSVAFRGALGIVALVAGGCQPVWNAKFVSAQEVAAGRPLPEAPYLKCHLADGRLYVLDRWRIDVPHGTVTGHGDLFDASRRLVSSGDYVLRTDELLLFETNKPEDVLSTGAQVAIIVVASLAVAGALAAGTVAYCTSRDKACFGSCPTFYASDGRRMVLQAEGFSSSVARALEKTDVDSLFLSDGRGGDFPVVMTNEALETHFVRRVRLLALARPAGARVLRAGGSYFPARELRAPRTCRSATGDCGDLVREFDGQEYFSLSDEADLATRETIELVLPATAGRAGLVVGARNTLLNTFLFYQALAWLGRTVGDFIASLERRGAHAAELQEPGRMLGDIDVEVKTKRGWVAAGSFAEVGPIARDVQLVPLPDDLPPGDVYARLHLTRGNFRVDYVAVAALDDPVAPVALDIARVERAGHDDPAAFERLLGDRHLVTYPGDAYTLHFALPAGEHDLFLESTGYYYEWMRREWLAEEDPAKAGELLLAPRAAMRRLAPMYKRYEEAMERVFWGSRLARPAGLEMAP